jgi:membrane-associated phospholipid phosphatase
VSTLEAQVRWPSADAVRSRLPLRGVAEATALIWVYACYAILRNRATGSPASSLRHADQILLLERTLGIDFGQRIRDAIHPLTWLISIANWVYATHALIPVVVLVLLYRVDRARYRRWRNAFVAMLALALIAFWIYPVMPPWILTSSYHFVDTSRTLSVGHVPLRGVIVPHPDPHDVLGFTNPYAAMPSLHVAWALFASLAAWPLVRRRWLKAGLVLYPILMSFAVIITANHWILDAVGGMFTVGAALLLASLLDRTVSARRDARDAQPPGLARFVSTTAASRSSGFGPRSFSTSSRNATAPARTHRSS